MLGTASRHSPFLYIFLVYSYLCLFDKSAQGERAEFQELSMHVYVLFEEKKVCSRFFSLEAVLVDITSKLEKSNFKTRIEGEDRTGLHSILRT